MYAEPQSPAGKRCGERALRVPMKISPNKVSLVKTYVGQSPGPESPTRAGY